MVSDTSPISVLCVDDEPGMADLIGTHLERADEKLSATPATSVTEATELLAERDFDCIVSDYDMPDSDGLVFLESIRAERPEFPFLLFTGRGSEEIASDAIHAGVTDYMQKQGGTEQYRVLAQRVRNAVSRHRLSKEATTVKEHAETILRASPNAVFVGIDGRCVYANPAAVELLAPLPESEIIDAPIGDFLRQRDDSGDVFAAVQRGETTLESRRLNAVSPERTVPVEGAARNITWDGQDAVVYILQDVSERVAYEQEIQYRQSLLDSVFEASPDGICIANSDREVLAYNEQFASLWNIPEDVLDTADGTLVLESMLEEVADTETFRENIDDQFENPDAPRHTQVRLTDGTVLDRHSAPVRSSDDAHAFVWFYRDVTELTELQQTQQEAFDRMTDAVFAVDEEWTFTFLNQQAEQLLQRDADELLGKELWDEFPEAAGTDIEDNYRRALETGEPVSFESYYAPLGMDIEVRAFPSDTGMTVYFRDITEQRRTEAHLQDTVDTLHALSEIASDPEMSVEEKRAELLDIGCEYLDLPYGFVTEITESTQTIVSATGEHELLQPGEACPIEQSYCRKTVSTERGLLAVQNALTEGWEDDPAYERFQLGTYIGGKVLVDSELYGTICFAAHDAREREFSELEATFVELLSRWLSYELEQQEHRSQLESKNDQLEEFASIVSHDLRNPLSVAQGYLELAAEDCDSEHIEKVERAHDRIQELIEDILMLAREGEVIGELTHVDLADCCEACWRNVETGDATLRVETDAGIIADESRLRQLLENLVRNSIEHGGDDVTVTVGDLDDGFYVEDDGPGIPEDVRATLFETGTSTKSEGTGIGLRIVRQVVTAHGWEIEAMSSASGGARFEITGIERP